jgi:anti-sigma factor RsiW
VSTPTSGGHLDLELQDLLDGRADPHARALAEAHLRECAACRNRLAALDAARAAIRTAGGPAEPVPDLIAQLQAALDREDTITRRGMGRRRWTVAATAVAASLLAAVLLLRGRGPDAVDVVIRDYRTQSATLPVGALHTSDVGELERFLRAANLPFPVRVLDLGMMRWELVGGGIEAFEGRPSIVLAYRRDGRTVICRMYLGSTAALPAGARVEEHRGFHFHVYEREGVTAVFWQEGPTVCVLIGDGRPRDVVELAIEKAMLPTIHRLTVGPTRPGRSAVL